MYLYASLSGVLLCNEMRKRKTFPCKTIQVQNSLKTFLMCLKLYRFYKWCSQNYVFIFKTQFYQPIVTRALSFNPNCPYRGIRVVFQQKMDKLVNDTQGAAII